MKSIINVVCGVFTLALVVGDGLFAAVRVETRGAIIATGVESLGSVNGSSVTQWDTTKEPDGWKTLTSGSVSTDVLILNKPLVVGGRLTQNATWNNSRVVVVRDDVVVPSGKTLTLGTGCIVKFTEGAQFVIEKGGSLVANGAHLATLNDDSVGGDTDMNGDVGMGNNTIQWWLEDASMAVLSNVRFVDGATNLPTRSYSSGRAYGTLPILSRKGEVFSGWYTMPDGEGTKVSSSDVVKGSDVTLYASWSHKSSSVSVDEGAKTVGATTTSGVFSVSSNGTWNATCSADWVTVKVVNGKVSYTLAKNASAEARSATIRIRTSTGEVRDFTLTQSGLKEVATPVIDPADGTEFDGASRRVSISCSTAGAEIRYTLDGSEPTESSSLYTKSFNIFDTTVVMAKAFKNGMLPGATASANIVRHYTLEEALDVPLWTVTTDGAKPWTVSHDVSHDGQASAKSGPIGKSQTSSMATTVNGSGSLSFWWKVDCEDDEDSDNWDYLKFEIDGKEIARVDGDSGWKQLSASVKGEGRHTLKWTYVKDYTDDNAVVYQDCGWVDQVSWTALAGNTDVPVAWIESIGTMSVGMSAADAASLDADGDGLTTAQEYITGTDPNDPDSVFMVGLAVVDGKPVVSYTPNLLADRRYTIYGKKQVSDREWQKVQNGKEGDFRFFRVSVSMTADGEEVFSVNDVGFECTVTFNANGGAGGMTQTVASGAAVGELPTPTRSGYAFAGWYTAKSGGEKISTATKVTSNVTYYAHWTAIVVNFTVMFNANGGTGGTTRTVAKDAAVGTLPTPTRSGYTFEGWFTAASGGSKISSTTKVSGNVTYYAHWTASGGGGGSSGGGDTPAPVNYTVTFNANGGIGGTTRTVANGAVVGALPAPTRDGYTFDGWFTAKTGGNKVDAATKVTGNVTYYARWTVIVVNYGGTVENVAFSKAQTAFGALYDARGNLVGTVELKFGKINARKRTVKIAATATLIVDGKAKKVSAKAVNPTLSGGRLGDTLAFKAPVGNMAFSMDADGVFTLKNGSYEMVGQVEYGGTMQKLKVGGAMPNGTLHFDLGAGPIPDFGKDGTLLDAALPDGEPVLVAGGTKWSFRKSPSLKYKKDKATGVYRLEGLDDASKPNLSGLKLSYTAKTGIFKGSFKMYATNETTTPAGKSPKLKKYTVNVIGFVVDGKGEGQAVLKKPAASWSVTVE